MCTVAPKTSETYNGWTNRETWAVVLWIDNEQGWQDSVHDAIRESLHLSLEVDASFAGEVVRENVEDTLDMLAENDLDTFRNVRDNFGSLWRVDWREVGQHFLTSVLEQDR
jgi:hypothetical protein